uniref:Arginyl-tRNA--protein transferase 1 n=1 Tax=Phallusia mammillata TaxID=59560 RepID=A0A6F9D7U2_9ASCI|nr:arginyl-tRNA--protein transferase 1-like [Phallusia mammillata]
MAFCHRYSIVEYRGTKSGRHCGYCSKSGGKFNAGMWAHSLDCRDYQSLINRGWRRSGQYCYKPSMDVTCCPLYGIRCHAESFKPSKSQKKVVKRMRQFLTNGGQKDIDDWKAACEKKNNHNPPEEENDEDQMTLASDQKPTNSEVKPPVDGNPTQNSETEQKSKVPRKGNGPDPTKPPPKKAKQLRLERKLQKAQEKGNTSNDTNNRKPKHNAEKTLEELLPHLNVPENAKHRLELRLVACQDREEFDKSRKESYELYKKYQMAIHKDHPSDCPEKQWSRFLLESPLNCDERLFKPGLGSFHNQYWLDDKLIAVGVMDILTNYVSSVYLYYDPDYGFLSLGVYSALSELVMTKRFHALCPNITHYCMGYFNQQCTKMKYKSKFRGSELLCPETYTWVPVEKCIPALEKNKYCRLNVLNGGSPDAEDEDGKWETLDEVLCLYRRVPYNYKDYQHHKYIERRMDDLCPPSAEETAEKLRREDERIRQYATMAGKSAKRILLFRSEADDYY